MAASLNTYASSGDRGLCSYTLRTSRMSQAGKADTLQAWRGVVQHVRQHPIKHVFQYPFTMWSFDPTTVEKSFSRSGYGWRKPSICRFRDQDFIPGDTKQSLAERARHLIKQHCGFRPEGRMQLFTVPRQWGILFNPVSFLLLYHQHEPASTSEQPCAIIAEITNTPWGERFCYILDRRDAIPTDSARIDDSNLTWDFSKAFHISPFNPMEQRYRWQLQISAQRVTIQMHNRTAKAQSDQADAASLASNTVKASKAPQKIFTASMILRPLPRQHLWRAIWSQPLGGLQSLWRIYCQAFHLWRKGAKFYDHPHSKSADRGRDDTPAHVASQQLPESTPESEHIMAIRANEAAQVSLTHSLNNSQSTPIAHSSHANRQRRLA